MITERYENRSGGHYKFWEVTYPDHRAPGSQAFWRVRWGRIGTAGQEKTFHTAYASRARADALAKITEKLGKGYEQVSTSQEQPRAFTGSMEPAAREPSDTDHEIDDDTRSAVLALLDANFECEQIAKRLNLRVGRVRAIAAHYTMGKYESPTGNKAAVKSARGKQRAGQLPARHKRKLHFNSDE